MDCVVEVMVPGARYVTNCSCRLASGVTALHDARRTGRNGNGNGNDEELASGTPKLSPFGLRMPTRRGRRAVTGTHYRSNDMPVMENCVVGLPEIVKLMK